MKALVSGFESFGNNIKNPTKELIHKVQEKKLDGVEIKTALLPVEYDNCFYYLKKEIESFKPDIIISCGLYANRSAISIERLGINIKDTMSEDPIPDNRGYAPTDETIDVMGPDAIFTNLPYRKIVNQLIKKKIPAHISNSAGTYICNNIMYETLNFTRKKGLNTRVGFIHFPADTDMAIENPHMPSLPIEVMLKALVIAIETTARN
ncbi:pyroglutamyl-peptidase I [Chromohalobacter israelensis]|uniref:pyroglutamyl-peptidase I n=1 Tax=Chromohalobacter israelensis TaxID=141390 RepID=UPI001CC4B2B5|nr:pyroglutamyl-peptidase I [Chromohalobacter salexigens]MBZ5875555.1 pyroglutamyl-peptidase I [Chromohalobacter salexigens]